MKVRGIRGAMVAVGTTALICALSGGPAAAATPSSAEPVCGPEVDAGPVVYQHCGEAVWAGTTQFSTQAYLYARNRGIAETNVTVTLQYWNYTTSGWQTDSEGTRIIGAGGELHFYSPTRFWSCGQDARERARLARPGEPPSDWSESTVASPC